MWFHQVPLLNRYLWHIPLTYFTNYSKTPHRHLLKTKTGMFDSSNWCSVVETFQPFLLLFSSLLSYFPFSFVYFAFKCNTMTLYIKINVFFSWRLSKATYSWLEETGQSPWSNVDFRALLKGPTSVWILSTLGFEQPTFLVPVVYHVSHYATGCPYSWAL